jgi:hypothetical protein
MAENNGQSSTAVEETEVSTSTNGRPKAKRGKKKRAAKKSAAARRAKAKEQKAKVKWSFPRNTLEQALKVPFALKDLHGGNPWEPDELRKAVGSGEMRGST